MPCMTHVQAIPTELGGSLEHDHAVWLAECFAADDAVEEARNHTTQATPRKPARPRASMRSVRDNSGQGACEEKLDVADGGDADAGADAARPADAIETVEIDATLDPASGPDPAADDAGAASPTSASLPGLGHGQWHALLLHACPVGGAVSGQPVKNEVSPRPSRPRGLCAARLRAGQRDDGRSVVALQAAARARAAGGALGLVVRRVAAAVRRRGADLIVARRARPHRDDARRALPGRH